MITQDFQTSYAELVKKGYHLHWFGGLIFTLIVALLYYFISDFSISQAVKGAVWINALFWGAKELIYGFINGVFSDREIVQKLKKFTIFGITPFGFGPADWKDFRFSIYGSFPLTIFIYILCKKSN
jgi:hypothetical protein